MFLHFIHIPLVTPELEAHMLSQEGSIYIQRYEPCSLLQGGTWPQASLNRSLFQALEKLKARNDVYKQFNKYEKTISNVLPEEPTGIIAQLLELQHSTQLLESNT